MYEIKREEIDKIIKWCEEIKQKEGKIYIVKRNPFKEEIPWMRNVISIEIDRPLKIAGKNNLVYNSITKTLYKFINGAWIALNGMKRL